MHCVPCKRSISTQESSFLKCLPKKVVFKIDNDVYTDQYIKGIKFQLKVIVIYKAYLAQW